MPMCSKNRVCMPAGFLTRSQKMFQCFPTLSNSKPLIDFKTHVQMLRSYYPLSNKSPRMEGRITRSCGCPRPQFMLGTWTPRLTRRRHIGILHVTDVPLESHCMAVRAFDVLRYARPTVVSCNPPRQLGLQRPSFYVLVAALLLALWIFVSCVIFSVFCGLFQGRFLYNHQNQQTIASKRGTPFCARNSQNERKNKTSETTAMHGRKAGGGAEGNEIRTAPNWRGAVTHKMGFAPSATRPSSTNQKQH